MAVIKKSVSYRGSDEDYQNISQQLINMVWHPSVNTVFITNGWHTAFETRIFHVGNGIMSQKLVEVWYFDYCVNTEGSAIVHYYAG